MKLYIKQKVFSWKDKFSVKDEQGNDRYFAEGELFSWGHKLHVTNASGQEVIYLEEKLLSFLSRYHVYLGGRQAAKIVREFTFFHPKYAIHGPDWTVDGDFWEHNYSIKSGEVVVASVSKEWFAWGDSYALEIADGQDELLVLAVILAIDCITADNSTAASSAAT